MVSTQAISVDVVKIARLPVEIMMVSISFVKESFKLIDVFISDFVVSVFLDFINEKSAPF